MIAAEVNRWWWPAISAAVAAAWIGVTLVNSTRFPPIAAAAAAGTALLAAAPVLPVGNVAGVTGIVAVLVLPLAVVEAARGGNAAPLAAVLGVVAVLAAFAGLRERGRSVPLLALATGLAGVVAGLTAGSVDFDRVHLLIADRPSAALILGGTVLVLVAIDARSHAERAVLAPVLLAALLAAPALPQVGVILGWAALAVGAAFLERPTVALAALTIVAAAAGAVPAALLLGAAAVLAAALDGGLAVLCGLPGAIALADALLGRPLTSVSVLAAVTCAATAGVLALRFRPHLRLDGGRAAALVVAGWLVLAPGTWSFSGITGLRAYDVGAARAVATGLIVGLVVVFRRGGEFVLASPVDGEDPSLQATTGLDDHPAITAAWATMATLASVGWLVVSVVRLH